MSELVQRLRATADGLHPGSEAEVALRFAADEIERLEADLEQAHDDLNTAIGREREYQDFANTQARERDEAIALLRDFRERYAKWIEDDGAGWIELTEHVMPPLLTGIDAILGG